MMVRFIAISLITLLLISCTSWLLQIITIYEHCYLLTPSRSLSDRVNAWWLWYWARNQKVPCSCPSNTKLPLLGHCLKMVFQCNCKLLWINAENGKGSSAVSIFSCSTPSPGPKLTYPTQGSTYTLTLCQLFIFLKARKHGLECAW